MPTPCSGCGVGVFCDYRLCISCGRIAFKQWLIRKQKKAKKTFETCLARAEENSIREMKTWCYTTTLNVFFLKPKSGRRACKNQSRSVGRRTVKNRSSRDICWSNKRQLFKRLFRTCWMNRSPKKHRKPKPYECPKKKNKRMDRKMEETLRLFDPFSEKLIQASFSRYDEESAAMVDREKETGEEKGRRYVRWRYS